MARDHAFFEAEMIGQGRGIKRMMDESRGGRINSRRETNRFPPKQIIVQRPWSIFKQWGRDSSLRSERHGTNSFMLSISIIIESIDNLW